MFHHITINKVLTNGTKAEIRVEYEERNSQFKIKGVGIIPKGKRKMQYIGDNRMTDNYSYRCLSTEDREKVEFKSYVEAVGINVLNEALNEAWEKSKPKPIDNSIFDIDFDVSNFI
ncbi:hypothetical protein [Paenibacillus sp. Marseille-Q4541]|uniref:hypothetical protein n=1 Tax=Paenibacillus sp. Marseille-Q4541 TaxID=2831522 RepID=UPI001BAC6E14|nr:hypothetical protein [Paenibacillus sp. Marseille-Q4541]